MRSTLENKLLFPPRDLAKYPFIPQAAEHIEALDLKITDLASPEYTQVLKRAEKRIEEAILSAQVNEQQRNVEVEILSFPIAVMIVSAINDSFLKRRYSLAEAKRAVNLLKQEEDNEKIRQVALTFNWDIRLVTTAVFALHFADFLRNSTVFHETEWKLINQKMLNGDVHLTRDEVARLLEEEVRRYVEKKLETKIELEELPQNVVESAERLKQLVANRKGKIRMEETPKEIIVSAFPPCISQLYNNMLSGRHVSHVGRFTLVSFLINSGMTVDDVVDLFRTLPDFNERLTLYQVEHIAGGRGSREKYVPPTCNTMRTHGVCQDRDEICRQVKHPLHYYRIKLRKMKATATAELPQRA